MGQDRVTAMGLEIGAVKREQNLLLVKGAVPGAKNGLVLIRDSIKKSV
jgi:large subunit ribosomal protein L3